MLVDDEEMVLTSIRANLSIVEESWEVVPFSSPEEAARHLERSRVDVIVSDYLMPRMNGLQLLARARELQPEAARILLTGHADKQSAIEAINTVKLFLYLEKPWDNEQLRQTIHRAIEYNHLLRELNETLRKLASTNNQLAELQRRLWSGIIM
jgi:DNA-binding NtrC family response regulator